VAWLFTSSSLELLSLARIILRNCVLRR
jgi:hypothetical protein